VTEKYADLLRQAEAEITSRWGEGRISPTRDRITMLLDVLGDPQRAYRAIHITGTNGKTTTARMIDELLRGFGLRTGRFTSPHLSMITERIVLDGEPVEDRVFVEAYKELAPFLEMVDGQNDVPLSFFEVMVALAYSIFADAPIDVAVVEVGLGGEWDATNVIDAEVAVVTPIGLDHVEYLGPDVATIAIEKSGSSVFSNAASRSAASSSRSKVSAASIPRSSCRCTALTRPRTPPVRWRRSKRSSARGRAAAPWTSRWCARHSRRLPRPAAWRPSALHRLC